MKQAVQRRDGGRCSFVGANGARCDARRFLEYDHVQPLALGGLTEVRNLRLLCSAHNAHEARRLLGRDYRKA